MTQTNQSLQEKIENFIEYFECRFSTNTTLDDISKEKFVTSVMKSVKERDKFVLGEEEKLSLNPNSPSNYAKEYSNDNRFQIKKRMEETL